MFLFVFFSLLLVIVVGYWVFWNVTPKGSTNAHSCKKWKLQDSKPVSKSITYLTNNDVNDSTFWVSHGSNGLISLINENGFSSTPDLTVHPSLKSSSRKGSPNGLCSNLDKKGFEISDEEVFEPADLICVSEDGVIAGFNASVSPSTFVPMVDASDQKKSFKRCCIVNQKLYVTEYTHGKIEIYNDTFELIDSFTDAELHSQGLSPYCIVTDHSFLYVSFLNDIASGTNGSIVKFDLDGKMIQRLISVPCCNLLVDSDSIVIVNDSKVQRLSKDTGAKEVTFRNEANDYLVVEGCKGLCFGANKLVLAQDSSLSLLDPK